VAATRVIEIRTEIPGPRSREILERERHAVARPLIVHEPIVADRARGSTITDVDGNTFVDFVGGVGVANVGHNHPRVVAAIAEQADRFLHTDFTVVPYEGYVELAERLGALAQISGETRGAFFNAGAEAVENAVKLARLYTKRQGVIAFEGAFHGRTWMALTMTSKTNPYKKGLGPFAPEVYRAPYPNAYRGPDAASSLAAIEQMFVTQVSPEHVAAIVFEPQQGEGGFVPAPAEFVEGLRRICNEHGIVLVADEVQTGFGRTARMFAMEHFDVEPDLMIVAKSMAGGLPLSGVIDGRRSWTTRTRERSAAPSSETRCRSPPRLPSSTSSPTSNSSRAPSSWGTRFVPECSRGSPAGRTSATSAASAQCSPSSSFAIPCRRRLLPSSPSR
jgi:4-aminobutyrate aminotransferase/(S)-3-amino-2-methylpropionate transaminase